MSFMVSFLKSRCRWHAFILLNFAHPMDRNELPQNSIYGGQNATLEQPYGA